MKNIGIFGIGAIGSLITKYIIRNQQNRYFFFNRTTEKDVIRILFNEQQSKIPIEISTQIDQTLDWLIICLKEYHIDGAENQLKELIGDNTKLAIFQNGMNLSDRYQHLANPNNLLETIIDCPVQRTNSDQLIHLNIPKIILPLHPISNEFSQLFLESDIEIEITEKFTEAQWIKLIESSAIGSIQAATGLPCSTFDNPQRLQEFIELVKEGILVARSEGVNLGSNLNKQLLSKLKRYPKSKGSSMLTDKLAGKKLELNAKIGAIIKIAIKNGIQVPTSKRIYNVLKS